MHFWRTRLGTTVLVLLLGLAAMVGLTVFQVRAAIRPGSLEQGTLDFESMMVRVKDVTFPAADGHSLTGWWIRGRPDLPPVILCHALGSGRGALINVALELRRAGFGVLMFDFRGHGDSGAASSTLGLKEKRDVIGAVDYLSGLPGLEADTIGVYGVGMGAYAAVLAAHDRPNLKVLVLDGLYPDVGFALARGVYPGWKFAERNLAFLPRSVFTILSGGSAGSERADDVIERLVGRDLLLLAPAGDSALTAEIERMYTRIPEQTDADGNLVVMPATQGDGLYGEQLARYHERVASFFWSRLGDG